MLKSCYRSLLEAGTDEAGRGCLAGPVTAAAIILPEKFNNITLNDSKQLSETKRDLLKPILEENAVSFSVCHDFEEEIDEINILNASFLAMHRAVQKLTTLPEALLIDGNRFNPYPEIQHHCIVKGDSKFKNIAAASVLAKTYRDEYMAGIAEDFPHYNWHSNKGYPTIDHRAAIREHGLSPFHRLSFRQLPDQLELELS